MDICTNCKYIWRSGVCLNTSAWGKRTKNTCSYKEAVPLDSLTAANCAVVVVSKMINEGILTTKDKYEALDILLNEMKFYLNNFDYTDICEKSEQIFVDRL